jgi:hypothetical protein
MSKQTRGRGLFIAARNFLLFAFVLDFVENLFGKICKRGVTRAEHQHNIPGFGGVGYGGNKLFATRLFFGRAHKNAEFFESFRAYHVFHFAGVYICRVGRYAQNIAQEGRYHGVFLFDFLRYCRAFFGQRYAAVFFVLYQARF